MRSIRNSNSVTGWIKCGICFEIYRAWFYFLFNIDIIPAIAR